MCLFDVTLGQRRAHVRTQSSIAYHSSPFRKTATIRPSTGNCLTHVFLEVADLSDHFKIAHGAARSSLSLLCRKHFDTVTWYRNGRKPPSQRRPDTPWQGRTAKLFVGCSATAWRTYAIATQANNQTMIHPQRRRQLESLVWPHVETPAQYVGGERNIVVKDHRSLRGKLCLGFPDAYTIGMSHHGLQVLYSMMNRRDDWCAERVFTPWPDMEAKLREHDIPLYSLETFTALCDFDVIGLSLQYEVSSPNVLTMMDLGGIPLLSVDRTIGDPLMLAGGPCCQNPEPMADYFDVMIIGDGEPALPRGLRSMDRAERTLSQRTTARLRRATKANVNAKQHLLNWPRRWTVPMCHDFTEPEYDDDRIVAIDRTRDDVPATIAPSTIGDLDGDAAADQPIVPYVECVHDRIAVEIMRGCPHLCRFCQSTVIKRPLRIREVETIVDAAWKSYRNTGLQRGQRAVAFQQRLSALSRPLVQRLHEVFGRWDVNVTVPSLRVNDQLQDAADVARR